jgi:mRNA interferase RelE/StbE
MCVVVYSIRIKRSAVKELERLPGEARRHVVAAIDRLAEEPLAGSVLKGEFSGLRRLRVGQYRVIYEAMHQEIVILVVRIGHRQSVYR